MANKNPFEIRAEMLYLAKDYMDKQIKMNTEYAEELHKLGKIQTEEYLKQFQPYTFDELMEKAQEMYSFVSNKE